MKRNEEKISFSSPMHLFALLFFIFVTFLLVVINDLKCKLIMYVMLLMMSIAPDDEGGIVGRRMKEEEKEEKYSE